MRKPREDKTGFGGGEDSPTDRVTLLLTANFWFLIVSSSSSSYPPRYIHSRNVSSGNATLAALDEKQQGRVVRKE